MPLSRAVRRRTPLPCTLFSALALWIAGFGAATGAGGETLTSHARIVDLDRQPVAGVRVTLVEAESPYELGRRQLTGGEAPVVDTVLSGEDGFYFLQWGPYRLMEQRIQAPGLTPIVSTHRPLTPDGLQAAKTLPAEPNLSLRVVDAEGRPVEGARIRVPKVGWAGGEYTSDPAGWARLSLRLYLAGPIEYPPEPLWVLPPVGCTDLSPSPLIEAPQGEETRVVLRKAVPQVLEVRSADGQPAEAVLVELVTGPPDNFSNLHFPLALSDKDGRATVPRPTRGKPRILHLLAEDGSWAFVDLPPADSGAPVPSTVTLQEPTRIRVRTRSAGDDAPLAGAYVEVARRWSVFTGSDGAAEVRLPLDPEYLEDRVIRAHADGYEEVFERRAIKDGRSQEALLRLQSKASLSGRVTDADGRGIDGAVVRVNIGTAPWSRGPFFDTPFRTVTDRTGHFHLAALPNSDEPFKLRVSAAGFAPTDALQAPLDIGEARRNVTVSLDPGIDTKVRVVDGRRRPVAGARATMNPCIGPGAGDVASLRTWPCRDDGTCSFEDLAPGCFEVVVAAPHYRSKMIKITVPATATKEEAVDLGEVVLWKDR